MSGTPSLVPHESLERRIVLIRAQRVMLDADLAVLYGVETKALKRAVNRNLDRFPEDFMFRLTAVEQERLRYQFGTLKRGEHSKYPPYAFTEHGVAMLSSVLRSSQAVQVNIRIMRAFARMRHVLAAHKELARKLEQLEAKVGAHDEELALIFEALKQLTAPPDKKKRPIGFQVKEKKGLYQPKAPAKRKPEPQRTQRNAK